MLEKVCRLSSAYESAFRDPENADSYVDLTSLINFVLEKVGCRYYTYESAYRDPRHTDSYVDLNSLIKFVFEKVRRRQSKYESAFRDPGMPIRISTLFRLSSLCLKRFAADSRRTNRRSGVPKTPICTSI